MLPEFRFQLGDNGRSGCAPTDIISDRSGPLGRNEGIRFLGKSRLLQFLPRLQLGELVNCRNATDLPHRDHSGSG